MLVLILAVFGVCWMPLQVAVLYSEYKPLVDTVRKLESSSSRIDCVHVVNLYHKRLKIVRSFYLKILMLRVGRLV